MKFEAQYMELEEILSEVIQTQKVSIKCFLSYMDISFEFLDMCKSLGIPTEAMQLVRGCGGRGEF